MRQLLRNIAEIGAGQGAPQGDSNFCDYGIPFVKAGNLQELTVGGSIDDIQKVSEEVAKEHKLKLYPKGTVLFAKSGMSCLKGYIYTLPQDAYVVSHLACITPKEDISEYLRLYFTFHRPNQLVKDAAYPSISLADIGNLEIDTRDEQTREHIITTLRSVEEIIALRKQELAALDDLIKARFVEMFGDPADNSRADKVELSEICEKITDGEHGSVARVPSGHPFLNAKHILKNGRIDWETITYVGDEDHQRIYKRCNPVEGDILLTTTGTIGNVAIMPKSEEVSMDRGITLLKIDRQKVTSEFVAELLKQPSIQTEMGVNVHASAIGHLFMNKVKKLPAILPSMERQTEFADFVRQVDKSKFEVQKSLDETQKLFDSLMQEYFG